MTWWMWLVACGDPEPAEPTETPDPVVNLTTRDGVDLVADTYQGAADAPGVVLLHMIPPANDRTNWPTDFIGELQDRGWWVIVPDRRGAGESGGVAQEAYTGPNGRYDVEAAVGWLTDQGVQEVALLGASNGTTSALDYALWAPDEGLPVPMGVGFLTGGTYTESQNAVTDLTLPAVFTFSTAERAWSAALQEGAPMDWRFHEYPEGDHGTRLFTAAPEVSADLLQFLESLR